MPEEKITATEARQATVRPRAMVLVLFASLFLCLMAGLRTRSWLVQSPIAASAIRSALTPEIPHTGSWRSVLPPA